MKLRQHLAPLGLGLMLLTGPGCGKDAPPATSPDPGAASSTSTPTPAAENPATASPAADAGPSAATEDGAQPSDGPSPAEPGGPKVTSDPARDGEVAAVIGETQVTRGTVVAWMNKRPGKNAIDVLDELVTLHLFGLEAQKAGFAPPADADIAEGDTFALGEAFAKATFASGDVSEEELTRWFAERRAAARLVVEDESLAHKLAESFRASPSANTREGLRAFGELVKEHSVEKGAIAPRRVLFDAAGLNEVGEPAVHEAIAKAAFALDNDGDISAPFALGEGKWAIVQRLARRPAVNPAEVPPHITERARTAIQARRSMSAMQTRAAELRKDVKVEIRDAALTDLAPAIRARMPISKGGALDLRRMRHDRVIGREPKERLQDVLPPGAEDELRKASPEEVQEKMGRGATP
jgi:hypothetical protein